MAKIDPMGFDLPGLFLPDAAHAARADALQIHVDLLVVDDELLAFHPGALGEDLVVELTREREECLAHLVAAGLADPSAHAHPLGELGPDLAVAIKRIGLELRRNVLRYRLGVWT